jgi:hypothetical protein
MSEYNQQIKSLFKEQLSNWELARKNYEGLKTVQTKSFDFDGYQVKVQFNPARIVSSGAKVDAKTISERKCFLCLENLPPEQKGISMGDYTVLVNPFPIFPEHFTIPHKEHISQEILPYFADMLVIAKIMSEYVVFYNGPRCGASAPDHLHFQAGTKSFLPLLTDYQKLKPTRAKLIDEEDHLQIFELKNYGRKVVCIETDNIFSAQNAFNNLYKKYAGKGKEEPLMNIVCNYEDGIWYVFILPRKAFRPWQFTAEADKQLLVSPATVEMCGIFITPIQEHFERISQDDIVSIIEQVTL